MGIATHTMADYMESAFTALVARCAVPSHACFRIDP